LRLVSEFGGDFDDDDAANRCAGHQQIATITKRAVSLGDKIIRGDEFRAWFISLKNYLYKSTSIGQQRS
jgi:hypothetical protein